MKNAAQTLRVPLSPLRSGEVVLDEPAARYVGRVHRLGAGDRFVAFDPEAASEADVEITSAGRDVRVRIGELRRAANVATPGLTLFQGIGKADKPEQVLRAATVLGVEHVVFVESRRAVVRAGERGDAKRRRWQAVAVEAARQSGRGDVPRVSGPLPLDEAVNLSSGSMHRVYLSPDAERGLADVLDGVRRAATLAVFIGPEGGLDGEEEAALAASGFVSAALGQFVLRTETATVAVLGAIAALVREG
ncbi:MAG TPA: RsmE family RNA methyltransferase [Polyangiaceae bacterium]|jgi:16S rRNA (uracil1498-N3)-methyltransferase|nr:RsmE family RNA methyltransferase [Polyangiaceae bacterium]